MPHTLIDKSDPHNVHNPPYSKTIILQNRSDLLSVPGIQEPIFSVKELLPDFFELCNINTIVHSPSVFKHL